MTLCIVMALITIGAGLAQFVGYRRMYFYVKQELRRERSVYRPGVAVILPCKGLDPGFAANVTKLFEQKYFKSDRDEAANFEILFVVARQDDPAYSVLNKLISEHAAVPAKLIVAGVNPGRAEKVNNQLNALKQISSTSEVLVFVDSDMIARPDFISHLVAPLANEEVGIATGYRFYIPIRGDWPSLLRSLWNRLTAWELASPHFAFAWGGAMAIRRANFERANMERVWDKAADDDLSMTVAVKKLGLKVCFVPQCLVASNGDASLTEMLEWTNRQLILTKVYYPALWRKAILRASLLAFWLLTMIACTYEVMVGQDDWYRWAGLMGLGLLVVELVFLIQAQKLWRDVLFDDTAGGSRECYIDRAYDQSLWRSISALPLAHCLLPWITLNSLWTNRIRWRGVAYELKSPNETVVVS